MESLQTKVHTNRITDDDLIATKQVEPLKKYPYTRRFTLVTDKQKCVTVNSP